MALLAFDSAQDPWEMDLVTHLGALPQLDPIERLPTVRMKNETPEAGDPDLQAAICAIENADLAATKRVTSRIRNADGAYSRRLQYCLLRAVQSENDSLVREILSRGVRVSKETLKAAIRVKALPLLSSFRESGWDINEPLGPWQPPCLSLCIHDPELVTWFLQNGADPDRRCEIDLTPLSTAVEAAPLEIIDLMLASSEQVGHGQLLHYAVRREAKDRLEVLRLVLSRGARIDHVMYENDLKSYHMQKAFGLGTALHEAARLSRIDVIEVLAAKGANPLVEDSLGRTPLQVAELLENRAAAEVLRRISAMARPPEYQFTVAARLQDAWR
ncbi:hypothetical protein LTR35_009175 [Friedmanniomyces endolithicus]|uniref:Ankyrin repeat domain-containing protein n=1 Tax=Friedmanniomyces endolithicus TaxID=329885 RepID=A0AAN6FKR1_9PEZI|nr:hypothetical protein LTR35_009175 [Friedmanniomyces endolithicus]KAK0292234.1 hypothetical protein LTS00_008069 [Friedmanniomyces endolithicus]KAK0320228.1 hypothetical protein LTR82_008745 [Friedmanniomyces endolithicus]KAK0986331.1 hypothetical protein LTR54_013502 [Friedmanniomyces endolithicus]